MSQPQVATPAKVVEQPQMPRIIRVGLRETITVAGATSAAFGTDPSIGNVKEATGFRVEMCRIGPDGMPVALKTGETWDGLRLSKVLHDRIAQRKQLHSAFIPKENVREIVYAAE